jgi:dTDP-4-amino-4,6-dideoxygalactose transaminase
VVVPSFTFAATAEAVVLAGGIPVLADIDPVTFCLDVAALRTTVDALDGPEPVGVIAVDLFGHPAGHAALATLAAQRGWWTIVDAAQSFGATSGGEGVGRRGDLVTTSFFPSKPLGCFGDGGAIICPTGERAGLLRSLRNHGAGADRYDHVRIGTNSRLDTLQAAILLLKLELLDDELRARARVAARYTAAFGGSALVPPALVGDTTSAWAQYTVRVPHRDEVGAALDAAGIRTAVHYRRTLAEQPAFEGAPVLGSLPVATAACADVLSLPLHPYLTDADQDRVIDAALHALEVAS